MFFRKKVFISLFFCILLLAGNSESGNTKIHDRQSEGNVYKREEKQRLNEYEFNLLIKVVRDEKVVPPVKEYILNYFGQRKLDKKIINILEKLKKINKKILIEGYQSVNWKEFKKLIKKYEKAKELALIYGTIKEIAVLEEIDKQLKLIWK